MKKRFIIICTFFVFTNCMLFSKANVVIIDPDGIKTVWHFNDEKLNNIDFEDIKSANKIIDYLLTIDYKKYLDLSLSDKNYNIRKYEIALKELSFMKELNSRVEACFGPIDFGASQDLIYLSIFDYQLLGWKTDNELKTGPISFMLDYTGITALDDYIFNDVIEEKLSQFGLSCLIKL